MSFCTFEILYRVLGNENEYPVLDQVSHTCIGIVRYCGEVTPLLPPPPPPRALRQNKNN